jgi:hypothetical protein
MHSKHVDNDNLQVFVPVHSYLFCNSLTPNNVSNFACQLWPSQSNLKAIFCPVTSNFASLLT